MQLCVFASPFLSPAPLCSDEVYTPRETFRRRLKQFEHLVDNFRPLRGAFVRLLGNLQFFLNMGLTPAPPSPPFEQRQKTARLVKRGIPYVPAIF